MKRLIAVLTNGLDLYDIKLLSKDSKQVELELERLNSNEHQKGFRWYCDQINDPTGHHETEEG